MEKFPYKPNPEELETVMSLVASEGDVAAHAHHYKSRHNSETWQYKLATALIKSALDDVRRIGEARVTLVAVDGEIVVKWEGPDADISKAPVEVRAGWARWWFDNPDWTDGDSLTLSWCCAALGVEVEFVQKLVRPLYGAGMPQKRVLVRTPGMPGSLGRRKRVKA